MSEQEASASKPEEQEIQAAEQTPSEEPQAAGAIDEGEKPSGETPPKDDPATEPAAEEPTAAGKEEKEEEEPEEEEPDDGVPIVLVTGASGFVATHLIKLLLEQGRYHVRGTVRSKKKEEKVLFYDKARTGVTMMRVHQSVCHYSSAPPPLPSQMRILNYSSSSPRC